jgi:hypothetical protein
MMLKVDEYEEEPSPAMRERGGGGAGRGKRHGVARWVMGGQGEVVRRHEGSRERKRGRMVGKPEDNGDCPLQRRRSWASCAAL